MTTRARIGVDIGGTFTDAVLEIEHERVTTKVLTTHDAPDRALMAAIGQIVQKAGLAPQDVSMIVHGTTLATNALIERKGAKTALITTEGFRDILEIRGEDRYDHHAIGLELPAPLVPRSRRLVLKERMSAQGEVLIALDDADIAALAPQLTAEGVEAIAVAFLHSYRNDTHEVRVGRVLSGLLPNVSISLSCEVSPEIREYDRISTTCANAYVQPLMAGYLKRLQTKLAVAGYACPLLLMLSSGGLTTAETSARFPVRLVESGPAGGALFAMQIAKECRLDKVLSFDMGGTTAKICMIENGRAQKAHSFEVARVYRFKKGSGLPLRIPVIELVEIGAGGGSIARVDSLNRITVGPDSAGSQPGPACYGRGGTDPTVTDADVILGSISPDGFAAGTIPVDRSACDHAALQHVGAPLGISAPMAAFGIREIVDENMAAAARVHAIECGMDVSGRTMIAFGGAAPLHAGRIAEKLKLNRFIIPSSAGVGSAVGFLLAPVGYEVVRSLHQRLEGLDVGTVNALLRSMVEEASAIVDTATSDGRSQQERGVYMRYVGQGHQLAIPLPLHDLTEADIGGIRAAFENEYQRLYSRSVPDVDVEILTWMVRVGVPVGDERVRETAVAARIAPKPVGEREIFDENRNAYVTVPVYDRSLLPPGSVLRGPAIISEDETTTVVPATFEALVNAALYIDCTRIGREA